MRLVADAERTVEMEPLPVPEGNYRLLDASTCQCHAATNANLANMVDLERHWARVLVECDTDNVRENLCLFRDGFALRSANIRNETAAAALEAFYLLAGLEARQRILEEGLAEAEESLERVDKLVAKGLDVPREVDRSELAGQVKELQDTLLQLEYARLRLNGQLQTQLGCPIDEHRFFWPEVDWTPNLDPPDAETEVALGLDERTDLRAIRLVICRLEKVTLPVARALLTSADATIGAVEPREGAIHYLRCRNCTDHEVPVRCRQLALLFDEKQDLAIGEIKSAVLDVTLQQHRVVLAREALELRQNHLSELEEKRDVDDVAVFELSRARAAVLEAESELVERLTKLNIAWVELRRSKHVLARECGFIPVLCCEGRCDGACVRCSGSGCQTACKTGGCNCN